jgi:hypothetical protein
MGLLVQIQVPVNNPAVRSDRFHPDRLEVNLQKVAAVENLEALHRLLTCCFRAARDFGIQNVKLAHGRAWLDRRAAEVFHVIPANFVSPHTPLDWVPDRFIPLILRQNVSGLCRGEQPNAALPHASTAPRAEAGCSADTSAGNSE